MLFKNLQFLIYPDTKSSELLNEIIEHYGGSCIIFDEHLHTTLESLNGINHVIIMQKNRKIVYSHHRTIYLHRVVYDLIEKVNVVTDQYFIIDRVYTTSDIHKYDLDIKSMIPLDFSTPNTSDLMEDDDHMNKETDNQQFNKELEQDDDDEEDSSETSSSKEDPLTSSISSQLKAMSEQSADATSTPGKTPTKRKKPLDEVVKNSSKLYNLRNRKNQLFSGEEANEARYREDENLVRICEYKSISLTRGDLLRLEEGEMLNDNLIDFSVLSCDHPDDYHLFNCQFFPILMSSKHAVERSAKRIPRLDKVRLFEKKLLFFPVNHIGHWILIIFVPEGLPHFRTKRMSVPLFIICDPLGPGFSKIPINKIGSYLKKRFKYERPNETPPTFHFSTAKVPLQQNGVDCGVYVIMYLHEFVSFPPTHLPVDRRDFKSPYSNPKQMRKHIHQKIDTLRAEYVQKPIHE
eukprot:CAMPEP_0117429150 /NCGR_PEP_ID=MMETSP0758-20121206/8717_1 /TAXON_ID=63605 /ORGANISM="Percolomonas cosmopolitus, Strain AE-1 (ATCC 50343)" /LENGTH=461 /DNA_ID=CAMNT_0005215937 /DNA_START=337 /DNA_END=1719 /DNA_ORIENTATION=-